MPKRALGSHLDDNEEESKIVITPVAYSILEFCNTHRFSRAHYYNMKARGLGPKETNAGGRKIITGAEARRWREANTE